MSSVHRRSRFVVWLAQNIRRKVTHAQVRDTQLLLTHLNWFGIEVVVNLSIGGSGGGGGEVLAGDSRTRGRLYKHPLIIKAKQEWKLQVQAVEAVDDGHRRAAQEPSRRCLIQRAFAIMGVNHKKGHMPIPRNSHSSKSYQGFLEWPSGAK